jgi:imidazolonepropionase-like amidohydrolase
MMLLSSLLLACTGATTPPADPADAAETAEADAAEGGDVVVRGVRLPGEDAAVDVLISSGRISAIGVVAADAAPAEVDLAGRWLAPGFIDSHVHVAYLAQGEALRAAGVVAAVDLAMPIDALGAEHGGLALLASGPMITAVGGYPTRSWGQNGYGLEVTGAEEAAAAVATLHAAGARVIKVPVGGSPALPPDALAAVVDSAHALDLKVAAHALDDAGALQAGAAGVDVLAHTPTEPLSAETLAVWEDRAVITSLAAFGGGEDTVANLSALRAAGATVLYGTDFGNTRTAAIQATELRRMQDAGLDGAAILAAGTSSPAAWWGFGGLGVLAVGQPATFLVLVADPHADPLTLAEPEAVWIDGAPLE